MQTSTALPTVTNFTTTFSNITTTTTITKSQEQILTQSSGAMIAVIVIGIIIILAFLLVILKTYNRRTHASRVLGSGSKPRQKKMSSSTIQTSVPLGPLGASSVSGSFAHPGGQSETGFRLPRVDLAVLDTLSLNNDDRANRMNNAEQLSVTSRSTVVTIHGHPSLGNT